MLKSYGLYQERNIYIYCIEQVLQKIIEDWETMYEVW